MVVDANRLYQSLQQCKSREDYTDNYKAMERRLKTLSCGLAEVTLSSNVQIIQFIHQSVKDFFIEKGLLALDDSLKSAAAETKTAKDRLRDLLRQHGIEPDGGTAEPPETTVAVSMPCLSTPSGNRTRARGRGPSPGPGTLAPPSLGSRQRRPGTAVAQARPQRQRSGLHPCRAGLPCLRTPARQQARSAPQREDLAIVWLHQDSPSGPIQPAPALRELPAPHRMRHR